MAANPSVKGVLDERRDSAGILLALLGQDAMRRLRSAHTEDNLSPRQFHLLGLLHDSGPIGQTELGQSLATDPSVLVTQLNPLEEDGLIARERDPADRRRHLVELTAAGEAKLRSSALAQRRVEDELFAGLDAEQREQLGALLTVLRDSHGPGRPSCAGDEPQPDC
jgi:DNA-binding MarR family transcriptional regulator